MSIWKGESGDFAEELNVDYETSTTKYLALAPEENDIATERGNTMGRAQPRGRIRSIILGTLTLRCPNVCLIWQLDVGVMFKRVSWIRNINFSVISMYKTLKTETKRLFQNEKDTQELLM